MSKIIQTPSHKTFVQKRSLINLPRDIRESLGINEGDILDISLVDNKIIIEPMKLIPSSQAYFWSEKTQNDMIEANNDVKSGNTREFKNIKEFLEGIEQWPENSAPLVNLISSLNHWTKIPSSKQPK